MCGVPAWEIWGRKNTGTRDAHRFLRIRTWGTSPVCAIFALNWEQLRLIFPDTNLHTILKTLGEDGGWASLTREYNAGLFFDRPKIAGGAPLLALFEKGPLPNCRLLTLRCQPLDLFHRIF